MPDVDVKALLSFCDCPSIEPDGEALLCRVCSNELDADVLFHMPDDELNHPCYCQRCGWCSLSDEAPDA